jgi:hypothetical protein
VRQEGAKQPGEFRYADTYDVGVYQVQVLDAARTRRLAFAVNIDPAETQTELISKDKVAARFGQRPLIFCNYSSGLPDTVRRLREGKSMWELFLAAVLFALVAESFVANRRR